MQQQEIIELKFNKEYLEAHLYQSHEYDDTPDDLTVSFDRSLIQKSREIFEHYPELFNVTFDACVTSNSFEGKLRTDLIHFYKQTNAIYISFRNDWTGCVYELCLSDRLDTSVNEQLSPFSVYETVDNLAN